MLEINTFAILLIVTAISIIVVYLFNKIKIPPLIGFILTGILIGPSGFGLIKMTHDVELFSELGIVLILFSVGIDFSINKLMSLKKVIFLGGGVQVLLSIILITAIAFSMGYNVNSSIFLGFIIATSSTAIILKLLMGNAQIDAPEGRISMGILIFQDLAVVPMILMVPILAGESTNIYESIFSLILKLAGILLYIFISIKYIMPTLIFNVAKTKIKELFLFFIILLALLSIYLAEITGLSLALGAFIAGLIISETDYNHEALSFVEPLRDIFGSIFFISVGMLFNPLIIINNFNFILFGLIVIIGVKFSSGFIAVKLVGYPTRIILSVAFYISQVGEFAFVLAGIGLNQGIIDQEMFDIVISLAVLTLIVTPFLFNLTPIITRKLSNKLKLKNDNFKQIEEGELTLDSHIIIIGYGINGRNLALAAKYAELNYAIIEMNPITVKNEKANGEPIYYGDASKEAILHNLSIKTAKVCVIAISDPAATRAITSIVKKMNPKVYLISRTRFMQEVEPLLELGADYVIPEEYETSIQIFSKVLLKYLIPTSDINNFVNSIRQSGYGLFRNMNSNKNFDNLSMFIDDYDVISIKIEYNIDIIGQSLAEINFRNRFDLTLLAIERDGKLIANPKSEDIIEIGDIVICWGNNKSIKEFERYSNME